VNRLFLFILVLLYASVNAQWDSIADIKLNEVVITATKSERELFDTPAQVDLIQANEIEQFPVANVDDLLKTCANVNVNRSWGIFSKNSSVTMRGLEGSSRVLILVDGVPKNKLSGGSVNWHNLHPDQIERIEVIKGPASALYGNNSMGGVINIITKKARKKLETKLRSFAGSYNTRGGAVDVSGNDIKDDKGFYWSLFGNYRKGDGYIFELPEFIDETDVETYLEEYGGGLKVGYQLEKEKTLELQYNYYDELRGMGRQVFEKMGSHYKIKTHQIYAKYSSDFRNGTVDFVLYNNFENFFSVKESLNSDDEYRLTDFNSLKNDQGFWFTYSKALNEHHKLIGGIEYKLGTVEGNEINFLTKELSDMDEKVEAILRLDTPLPKSKSAIISRP